MRITQALCAAGPVDAVTNQGLAWRRLFRSWGWEGADYAEVLAPTMTNGSVRPLGELEPGDGELLLIHYSGYAPALGPMLERSRHSLLISHNITPARYFWADHPLEGVRCSLGPGQLAELGDRAEALAAVSAFNARELRELTGREVEVVPVLFDRARLGRYTAPPTGPPTILFVGRLAPHKRQDLVIRAFARYRERRAPEARLVLVGVPDQPGLRGRPAGARRRARPRRGDDRERSPGRASVGALSRGACVRVPVRARGILHPAARGAAFRRAGDRARRRCGRRGARRRRRAARSPSDDVDTVAELLEIVVGDGELRAELRARGERRLEHYDQARTAALLRERLLALAT